MEQDFQDIDELATEGGSKAILDEARWHGEDLAEQFDSLTGFHEHAFWTFVERPKYWQGALAFHHADTVPVSYWRKRKNVPRKPASVDALSIRQLEQNLSNYFHKMQGRGENCKVDCYNRNDLDYFLPTRKTTRRRASVEWVGKEFERRPHHPAFEIVGLHRGLGVANVGIGESHECGYPVDIPATIPASVTDLNGRLRLIAKHNILNF
jgi:hypothetical protein